MPITDETKQKQQQHTVPEPINRNMVVNGDQQLDHNEDQFYVSPYMKKQYGIDESEELQYVRDPEDPRWKGQGNRVKQMAGHYPGARVPKDEDGQPLRFDDLILMSYPKVHRERIEDGLIVAEQEFVQEIKEKRHPDQVNLRRMSQDEREELMEDRRRQNRQLGLMGGNTRTSGMSYNNAFEVMGREAGVKQTEDAARQAGRTTQYNAGVWENMMDSFSELPREDRPERPSKRDTNPKSVAMGDSGFARNPKSPLAQAQSRGRGK